MNFRMAQDFFVELVGALACADGGTPETNPAITFNEHAKAGEFDELSDAEYNACLHAVNEIAVLWQKRPTTTLSEVARRALSDCSLTEAELSVVAEVLGRAWVRKHGNPLEDHYFKTPVRYLDRERSRGGALDSAEVTGLLQLSPRQIAKELSRDVWGQEDAIRDLALMLWHHVRGDRRVTLLMGPTGSGKTLLANGVARFWPHVAWVDGSQVTTEGWKGDVKFSNMCRGMDKVDAEHAIVVIDEADKMFEPKTTSSGENTSAWVQTELLKLMDGGHTKSVLGSDPKAVPESLSMESVSFLLMGTFEHMLEGMSHETRLAGFSADNSAIDAADTRLPSIEDLVRYGGVRREIAGRINIVSRVSKLTVDDYARLLRDPARSPAVRIARQYGTSVTLTDQECQELAEFAASAGLGVRSLESRLEQRLDEDLWEGRIDPDNDIPDPTDQPSSTEEAGTTEELPWD